MQGTMPGARRRGRPHTAWMDNIKTWTGLPVEESIRMTEIHGESTSMVWPTLGSRTAKEHLRKQGSFVEKEIMQGTMPGACRRGRPHTVWMDNIKTWTGLPVEESIRMTEDRDKWRNYVHGVANPRI